MSADENWRIVKATASVDQPRVYANGRQQALVVLTLRAEIKGEPVGITQNEIDNIQVIDYHDPTAVIPSDEADYLGWTAQRARRQEYDYFDAMGSLGERDTTSDAVRDETMDDDARGEAGVPGRSKHQLLVVRYRTVHRSAPACRLPDHGGQRLGVPDGWLGLPESGRAIPGR